MKSLHDKRKVSERFIWVWSPNQRVWKPRSLLARFV